MSNVTDEVRALNPNHVNLPGKFEGGTPYDEDLHAVSLESSVGYKCTDADGGWIDVVVIDPDTDGAVATVATHAIVSEDSNGLVTVTYYDNGDEAFEVFNDIPGWYDSED